MKTFEQVSLAYKRSVEDFLCELESITEAAFAAAREGYALSTRVVTFGKAPWLSLRLEEMGFAVSRKPIEDSTDIELTVSGWN